MTKKLDQSNIRMPYVFIYYNKKTEIWPYVEAQEFCIEDLSDSIIRLTDREFDLLESTIKSLQEELNSSNKKEKKLFQLKNKIVNLLLK